MEELVWIVNDEPVTDSRLIAKYFHKEHGKVLRKIRKLRSQGCTEGFFIESKFRCEQNHQMFTNYFVTYDGFNLLFNGTDLDDTKMMFVEAFCEAEKEYNVPSCLIQPEDKRVKKWQKEEAKRKRLEDKVKAFKKDFAKGAARVLFADILLEKGNTISLQDLAWIITREDCDSRMQAMMDWLRSQGYTLPDSDLPTDD